MSAAGVLPLALVLLVAIALACAWGFAIQRRELAETRLNLFALVQALHGHYAPSREVSVQSERMCDRLEREFPDVVPCESTHNAGVRELYRGGRASW